jgi:phosphate:Na+ symporter
VGVCIVLPFLPQIVGTSLQIEPNMARLTAEFHIALNVALAVIFLLLLDPLAWLLVRLLPDRKGAVDPAAPRYLDESALETPSLALANAARETLHMGDTIEAMLKQVMTALMTNNRALVDEVSRMGGFRWRRVQFANRRRKKLSSGFSTARRSDARSTMTSMYLMRH